MDPNYEDDDALYQEAVKAVREVNVASIALVQRRLRIGYNRAARFIEQMEINGIVSDPELNGARTVLPVKV